MTKQKKPKLRIPKWLAITLLVLGILFLLGGTTGEMDMLIIGTVLTALAIVGFVGNSKKSEHIKPLSVQTENISEQRPQPIVQQNPTLPKKSRSPLAILRDILIIIVLLPIVIIMIVIGSAADSNKSKEDEKQQHTQQTDEQQAEDEAAAKKLTKTLIESYVPKYCETHQQRNVPLPPADGEQYGEGKNYLTTKECRAIITYLVDRVGSSAQSLESISNAEINIGMNRHELLMAWGLPRDINSTHTAAGERAQWVYNSSYVYLENDIITVVQN